MPPRLGGKSLVTISVRRMTSLSLSGVPRTGVNGVTRELWLPGGPPGAADLQRRPLDTYPAPQAPFRALPRRGGNGGGTPPCAGGHRGGVPPGEITVLRRRRSRS